MALRLVTDDYRIPMPYKGYWLQEMELHVKTELAELRTELGGGHPCLKTW